MISIYILRLNGTANYTDAVKILNTEFKEYSKIYGRDFLNPISSEMGVGYRLLYLYHQGVFLTIAIEL